MVMSLTSVSVSVVTRTNITCQSIASFCQPRHEPWLSILFETIQLIFELCIDFIFVVTECDNNVQAERKE